VNKRPLAIIAIFFILGIILARSLPDSIRFPLIFISTLIFILTSFIFSKYHKISNILLLLSITSFASLLYINSHIYSNNHISHFLAEEKLKTSIAGVIKSPVLTRKPYYGKINSTYLFEIEGVKVNEEWLGLEGLAQIRLQTEKDYAYGDRLLVKGTVRRPRNDNYYREYLERQNIFALINTKENYVTLLEQGYKSNPVLKYTYLIRERLKARIIEKMPLEKGAFLRAILMGDRSELPKHIQASFKNSGTMHILAISGLHIGLIALLVMYLLRFLRMPRGLYYIFTILFLIFFIPFTLSRPSVMRAVLMACVFLVGRLLGRGVDVYNSLGIAAVFILIKNPKDLFNVGFQLSFLAVFSILFFVPKFMKLLERHTDQYIKKYFYMSLTVSIAAWLGTALLILYYFRIITPIAIISNLFIIPVLFILLIGSFAFLLLGWLPFAGSFLIGFNSLFAGIIFELADFFGSLRFGHFYLG